MLKKEMTVREAIETKVRFDRVCYVDETLRGKSWGAPSHRDSHEYLLENYGDNLCQQSVVEDSEGFYKYSLIIWVKPDDGHVQAFKKFFEKN